MCGLKSFTKNVGEIEHRIQFHQHFSFAFIPEDPKSKKKPDNLIVFFVLLGSAFVKALSKMLVKLTPVPTLKIGLTYEE